MAWDDVKVNGNTLTPAEWNTHVTDQKGHAARHNDGGADAITLTAYAKITEGTYTGDGTQNRAIPHGLGIVPGVVIIGKVTAPYSVGFIVSNLGTHCMIADAGATTGYTQTAPDNVNFYVGGVGGAGLNVNLAVYHWRVV